MDVHPETNESIGASFVVSGRDPSAELGLTLVSSIAYVMSGVSQDEVNSTS